MSEKLYKMSDLCLENYVIMLYNVINGISFMYTLPKNIPQEEKI